MTRRLLNLLAVLSLLLCEAVVGGCVANHAAAGDSRTVCERFPSGIPVEPNAVRAVPIVYCDRLPTLTADQSDLILRAAEENKPSRSHAETAPPAEESSR